MSMVIIRCARCRCSATKTASEVNRARKAGYELYCTRACAGVARRVERSAADRLRLKAEYDAQRRLELRDRIRAEKREYFQRTYDPAKARAHRKGRMAWHVEYCRRYYADPTKKREKVEYDLQRRAAAYADFAEAWRLLIELEKEIRARCPDKYERAKARGYYDKLTERKYHEHQARYVA